MKEIISTIAAWVAIIAALLFVISFFMVFFTFRHFAGSRFLTETAEKLPVISGRKTAGNLCRKMSDYA